MNKSNDPFLTPSFRPPRNVMPAQPKKHFSVPTEMLDKILDHLMPEQTINVPFMEHDLVAMIELCKHSGERYGEMLAKVSFFDPMYHRLIDSRQKVAEYAKSFESILQELRCHVKTTANQFARSAALSVSTTKAKRAKSKSKRPASRSPSVRQ